MLLRSFTNVTRPGVDSFTARLLPRLQPTIFQCMFFAVSIRMSMSQFFFKPGSHNVTLENSAAFVRRDDPSYTSLPPDSRKPPAPVDPSSKILSIAMPFLANVRSLQMVLHLFGTGLEQKLYSHLSTQIRKMWICCLSYNILEERKETRNLYAGIIH
jgi:hypothetical protein